MKDEMPRREYFAHLLERLRPGRVSEVRRAIEREGRWEQVEEVRLHALAEMHIEPIERSGVTLYHVRVGYDLTFECFCPSLDRAVQFLNVCELLAGDLCSELGRPSVPAPPIG